MKDYLSMSHYELQQEIERLQKRRLDLIEKLAKERKDHRESASYYPKHERLVREIRDQLRSAIAERDKMEKLLEQSEAERIDLIAERDSLIDEIHRMIERLVEIVDAARAGDMATVLRLGEEGSES
jgi:chromosome segregation ATPase